MKEIDHEKCMPDGEIKELYYRRKKSAIIESNRQ